MFPTRIIYDSKKGIVGVDVRMSPNGKEKILYTLLRGIGAGLIAFFILIFGFTIYPIVREEISFQRKGVLVSRVDISQQGIEEQIAQATGISEVQKEALTLGVDSSFSIVIPKIDARSKIIANVSAGDEKEYSLALKEGVAHAKGTYFPGQGESIYLFAHSTDSPLNFARYNAVFYLLRKLEVGDEIIVFFSDKKYEFFVDEKVVTEATDTTWYSRDFGKETLILQTCYPPGTSLKRLIIRAS